MTITKEQLIARARSLIQRHENSLASHPDQGGVSMDLELARMALAGMEAVHVGFIARHKETGKLGSYLHPKADWFKDDNYEVLKAYDTPQPLTTSERSELENYRNAQRVVPDDGRDQFEEWFKFHRGDEHSIVMLQRANGGANYIDPYVDLAWISWKDSRAAMLHGKAEQVGKMPDDFDFDRFNDVVWLEAVASNPHMHSLTTSTIAMVALELNRRLDADGKPELTVWYGPMPESIGKTNWTAMLHRKGQHPWEGITIDCSEYPERTLYEADRMRHLIGELADEPDILAYDADKHSGYVAPGKADGNSPVIPDGWVACSERMPDIGTEIFYFCQDDGLRDCGIVSSSNFSGRGDAQLYVHAEGYDLRFGVDITHWMPLPAAPQQESE